MSDNPKLSIRVSAESVPEKIIVTEEFRDEAQAREILHKRGWTVESIEAYQEPKEPTVEPPPEIAITTAPWLAAHPGAIELGIVTAECVFGTGPFKDIAAGFRNLVGGRAAGMENLFREARDAVLAGIKNEARRLGATGIVAIDFRYDTIATQHGIMQLAYAVGTAVRHSVD